jgi:hypothetical protein
MAHLHAVPKDPLDEAPVQRIPAGAKTAFKWFGATFILFALGSWLVWLALYLQHRFVHDEIRAACQRLMPDTADRCIDTVIIQRGGARR